MRDYCGIIILYLSIYAGLIRVSEKLSFIIVFVVI